MGFLEIGLFFGWRVSIFTFRPFVRVESPTLSLHLMQWTAKRNQETDSVKQHVNKVVNMWVCLRSFYSRLPEEPFKGASFGEKAVYNRLIWSSPSVLHHWHSFWDFRWGYWFHYAEESLLDCKIIHHPLPHREEIWKHGTQHVHWSVWQCVWMAQLLIGEVPVYEHTCRDIEYRNLTAYLGSVVALSCFVLNPCSITVLYMQ